MPPLSPPCPLIPSFAILDDGDGVANIGELKLRYKAPIGITTTRSSEVEEFMRAAERSIARKAWLVSVSIPFPFPFPSAPLDGRQRRFGSSLICEGLGGMPLHRLSVHG